MAHTRTIVGDGLLFRPFAKASSTGRSRGSMAALLVAKEMSLGTSSFNWLSAVRVTSTPVPCVACSIARRLSSMWRDQTLPATAPSAPPINAPVPALPPVAELMTAPETAPIAAPPAVPRWRSSMFAQPARTAAARAAAASRVCRICMLLLLVIRVRKPNDPGGCRRPR